MVGGCQGAVSGTSWAGYCYPFYIWSGSEVSTSSYHQVYEVNAGSLRYVSGTCGNDAYGKCINSWALSVRCVLGLKFIFANSKCRQLQLCDAGASSSYGAARCNALIGGCQGSSNPNCHPFFVWSGSKVSESVYQVYELSSGAWHYTSDTCGSYGKCGSLWASSVRCVLGFGLFRHKTT